MQNKNLLKSINRSQKTTWSSHLEWYNKLQCDESRIVFSIENSRTGKLIGQCGLRNIDPINQKAELWIFIGDHRTRGHGYGSDAVKHLIEYAFNKQNLNRLYLYVLDFNLKARLFYEHLGFKQEGIYRQDVSIDGTFHDTVHMAILKEEYGSIFGND